jgi:hypothetical protein
VQGRCRLSKRAKRRCDAQHAEQTNIAFRQKAGVNNQSCHFSVQHAGGQGLPAIVQSRDNDCQVCTRYGPMVGLHVSDTSFAIPIPTLTTQINHITNPVSLRRSLSLRGPLSREADLSAFHAARIY